MQVIDFMRFLIENVFRMEYFHKLMKNMHFKNYSRLMTQREHSVMKKNTMIEVDPNDKDIFSIFSGRQKYRGIMPSANNLKSIYKKYHYAIENCIVKEMKKIIATTLHFDISHNEAKILHQQKGTIVFKGLAAGTNTFGAVRLQFNIVTDSNDQMRSAFSF